MGHPVTRTELCRMCTPAEISQQPPEKVGGMLGELSIYACGRINLTDRNQNHFNDHKITLLSIQSICNTSAMSCPKCFSGHVNTSTPKGRKGKVFDRDCYIAEPEAGKDVKGIIVIISDAFGWNFVNNQILADHYATRGDFKVYLPDFMDGEYYDSCREIRQL
jgi:hypothetical protein